MSNFVFSRRALQRSIDHLGSVIERDQLVSIVDRLNRHGDARLPAMWELVMLDALAWVGELRHEVEQPNGRRPDIELTVRSAEGESFLVVGDVATVSDAGLDEQNPVGVLSEELIRLARKGGLNPHHFGFHAPGGLEGSYGDGRMKLCLPPKAQLLALMQKEVPPWIQRLLVTPQQSDRLDYAEGTIRFSLTYDPTQCFFGGGHPSYQVAASRDKNPLFLALKGKTGQLKQASEKALRLIIACDGDNALLRQDVSMRASGNFTAREVAEDFLRQNSSVDAVLLVSVAEQRQTLDGKMTYSMEYQLVIAPERARSARMTPEVIDTLEVLVRAALKRMPQPIRSAYNAAALCRLPGSGSDMIGGYKMDRDISLSSRGLLRLLAGEITVNQFIAAHGWNEPSNPRNPFASMMSSGRMITKISVEGAAGFEDDDWLTFSFGPPDPAAGPFRVNSPIFPTQPDKTNHEPPLPP